MDDVIRKIEYLKNKYPLHIKTYKPVGEASITLRVETLKFDIGDELTEIYKYSDGISFLDYCLLGVLNKRIGRLTPPYLFEEERLEFIGAIGKQFLLSNDEHDGKKVWFKEDNRNTDIVVAHSVHEFFLKFLDKIDVLLGHFNPGNIVAYFEDADMPPGLAEW